MKTEEFTGVDLSDFLPVDTSTLEILKPGGTEGTGWIITFAGPEHPKTVAWAQASAKRSLAKAKAVEQAQVNGRKFKSEDKDPDEVRRENVAWVVARIVDWSPLRISGKDMPFSEAAATELMTRPGMGWAYQQCVDFLSDERSFMKTSAAA